MSFTGSRTNTARLVKPWHPTPRAHQRMEHASPSAEIYQFETKCQEVELASDTMSQSELAQEKVQR